MTAVVESQVGAIFASQIAVAELHLGVIFGTRFADCCSRVAFESHNAAAESHLGAILLGHNLVIILAIMKQDLNVAPKHHSAAATSNVTLKMAPRCDSAEAVSSVTFQNSIPMESQWDISLKSHTIQAIIWDPRSRSHTAP